jgi:Domain of unknown function (DUF5668)/N-terminal domain of toast_rack, DUF2154
MQEFRRPSLFWPLVLISLGALLLLQNIGLLPAGLWAALAQLWPVALILLGLDLLIGRRSSAGAALVIIAGVLLVAGALTWAALRAQQLPLGGDQRLAQTVDGAARANVTINFRAGALRLSALGPSDHLMEATVHNGPGDSVHQDYSVSSGAGRLALEQQANALFVPFLASRGSLAQWDVLLARRLPLALDVNTGAGAATLDLTGLQLTSLSLSTGPGQTDVTFPAGQAAQASLRTGAGATTLNLPGDLALRLTVHSTLTNVSVSSRLARAGPVYTTPGFDPARPFLDLEVNAGLGSVTVK